MVHERKSSVAAADQAGEITNCIYKEYIQQILHLSMKKKTGGFK